MTSPVATTSTHDTCEVVNQLLIEIRQLLLNQTRLIEVFEQASKDVNSDQSLKISQEDAVGPARRHDDNAEDFWTKVLPTDQTVVSCLEVFMSWLRSMREFQTADDMAVVRPFVYADALVNPETLDEGGYDHLKSSVQESWPKGMPDFTKFKREDGHHDKWMVQTRDMFEIFHFLVLEPDSPTDFDPTIHEAGFWGALEEFNGPFDPTTTADLFIRSGMLCIPSIKWTSRSVGWLRFDTVALVIQALNGMYNEPDHRNTTCRHNFLARHATSWPASEPRSWEYIPEGTRRLQVYMHVHMRSFITGAEDPAPSPPDQSGIRCEREHGILSFLGNDIALTERRYSLAVSIAPTVGPCGGFSLVVLADPGNNGAQMPHCPFYTMKGVKEMFGIQTCFLLTGVTVFQAFLCISVESWKNDWAHTLSRIDEAIRVKVGDVLDCTYRDGLMYDTPKLDRSAFYFSLLQLLRIFIVIIKQTTTDLSRVIQDYSEGLDRVQGWNPTLQFAEEAPIIQKNWDIVLKRQKDSETLILGLINQKIEEIESLRDGLFNAQSVKEAIKGTQINQYLLVFTIVTLLYLPPTFVATFYGMHLFDIEDDIAGTQRQFWLVFGVISGMTYLIAAALLSGLHQWKKPPQSKTDTRTEKGTKKQPTESNESEKGILCGLHIFPQRERKGQKDVEAQNSAKSKQEDKGKKRQVVNEI